MAVRRRACSLTFLSASSKASTSFTRASKCTATLSPPTWCGTRARPPAARGSLIRPDGLGAPCQLINHVGDVKVSDFGIVRELEHSLEMANTFVGTLTYMSPERIAGEVCACGGGSGGGFAQPSLQARPATGILAILRHLVLRYVRHDLCSGPLPH